MSNSSSFSSGIGFFGLLALIFITLKLTGFIAWSWWWVLSPLLFGVGIIVLILIVLIICAIISSTK